MFSSVVIDHLLELAPSETYGVAYIYFSYKEQLHQKPIDVLTSLVKQLAYQLSSPLKHLIEKLEKTAFTNDEMYTVLIEITKSFRQTFVILDALDECHQRNQRKILLPMFHRMGKSGIKLFATSRSDPDDIEDSFASISNIEISAQKEDIKCYIYQRIREYPRARLWLGPQLEDQIISTLIDAADGMYVGRLCIDCFLILKNLQVLICKPQHRFSL
jgi:hypothetical protein